MKFDENLKKLVLQMLKLNNTVFMAGESGIGKSSVVHELAERLGTKAFTLSCNTLGDKADLTGARTVYDEKRGRWSQTFVPHDTFDEAIDYAQQHPDEIVPLLLDEVNRAGSADVTSGALNVLTERKIGRERLPANLRLMAAGNLRGNVTHLDEASLSRFTIMHLEPDAPTFLDYMGDRVNPWVKRVLEEYPEMIFLRSRPAVAESGEDTSDSDATMAHIMDDLDSGEEMLQLTTPRTLEDASDWLNDTDYPTLRTYSRTQTVIGDRETTVLREVLEGMLGNTALVDELMPMIIEDVSNSAAPTAASTGQITEPAFFASLKDADTIDDMDTIIATLSADDVSEAMLYAMTQTEDHRVMLTQLAASGHSPSLRKLMTMIGNDQFDESNLEHLKGTDTDAGKAVANIHNTIS